MRINWNCAVIEAICCGASIAIGFLDPERDVFLFVICYIVILTMTCMIAFACGRYYTIIGFSQLADAPSKEKIDAALTVYQRIIFIRSSHSMVLSTLFLAGSVGGLVHAGLFVEAAVVVLGGSYEHLFYTEAKQVFARTDK